MPNKKIKGFRSQLNMAKRAINVESDEEESEMKRVCSPGKIVWLFVSTPLSCRSARIQTWYCVLPLFPQNQSIVTCLEFVNY